MKSLLFICLGISVILITEPMVLTKIKYEPCSNAIHKKKSLEKILERCTKKSKIFTDECLYNKFVKYFVDLENLELPEYLLVEIKPESNETVLNYEKLILDICKRRKDKGKVTYLKHAYICRNDFLRGLKERTLVELIY